MQNVIKMTNSDVYTLATQNHTRVSKSFTVPDGDNRLLLVGVGIYDADLCGDVKYDDVLMTSASKIEKKQTTFSNYLYYLVAPHTGTHYVSASFTGVVSDIQLIYSSWVGVDQTNPLIRTGSNNGNSAFCSCSVTTDSPNDLVYSMVTINSVPLLNFNTSSQQSIQTDWHTDAQSVASSISSGSGQVTMSYVTLNYWEIVMAAIKAAGTNTHTNEYTILTANDNCQSGTDAYNTTGYNNCFNLDDNDVSSYHSISFRFNNINLSRVKKIQSATLTLSKLYSTDTTVDTNGVMRIRCQDSNTPAIFSTTDRPYLRPTRSAYVDYDMNGYFVGANRETQTIGVTSLVQDLLDAGYKYNGNESHSIVFTFKAGDWGLTSVSYRGICDSSGSGRTPAKLTITYLPKTVHGG